MKKQSILMLSFLTISLALSAQNPKEYKVAKSNGRLNLNISGAVIEGYKGDEIVFTASNTAEAEIDERAKGLRAISGSGFKDNTGLGIEVAEKGQDIDVNSVSKRIEGILTIKVPYGIKVVFNNNSNIYQSDVTFKNLKSEIEVSTSYNKIVLENNSGPMNIKTLYGTVDAVFTSEIKGPVSIVSVYGYVDVTMPTTTKANIELGSSRGNLYAADGFKIAIEKSSDKPVPQLTNISVNNLTTVTARVSGLEENGNPNIPGINNRLRGVTVSAYGSVKDAESINGKLNGGGTDLVFKSSYQNVYLRTK
ncbi:MAG: DUF4097 family beta strand repeat-containing protein [Pedobacter sp.]